MRLSVIFLPLFAALLCLSAAVRAQEPLTIEAFAMDNAIEGIWVSPNGERISVVRRTCKDCDRIVQVFKVSDMAARPYTIDADRMDIQSAPWADDGNLAIRFTQDIERFHRRGIGDARIFSRLALHDVDKSSWLQLPIFRSDRRSAVNRDLQNLSTAGLVSTLRCDPRHIIISADINNNGVSDYFKVNVRRGTQKLLLKGSSNMALGGVDRDGEVRFASSFNPAKGDFITYARIKGEKKWLEVSRINFEESWNTQLNFAFVGLDPDDPNLAYVLSNHDADTDGVFEYDLRTQKLGELLFRHPRYDANGTLVWRAPDACSATRIAGFSYAGKTGSERYFTDPAFQAGQDALDKLMPENTVNSYGSSSLDKKVRVVYSEGPKHPGTWYLLHDGKLSRIGDVLPLLRPEHLGDVEWKRFKARDGYSVPAIITRPPYGEPPWPTVVMPHGGPIARDFYGFDLWAQMLAHHGYLVVQPQFRMSSGFGKKHFSAGFEEFGKLHQDDIDDSGHYLVRRGLADPERMAIFGWSYGGYAAAVGSFRDPNPYKCAIAGAGAMNLSRWRADISRGGARVDRTFWRAYTGLDPADQENIDSIDIPLLLIHGDVDQRVNVIYSREHLPKLERAGKHHEYLELEGANHFFGTIFYRHWMQMFPKILDWLDNTCDMGGSTAKVAAN